MCLSTALRAFTRREALRSMTVPRRYLVGLAGVPGSGKTTLARLVAERIDALNGSPCCAVIGMDGWHYPQVTLDAMPHPAHAHARRGAAFTFDAEVCHSTCATLTPGFYHVCTSLAH